MPRVPRLWMVLLPGVLAAQTPASIQRAVQSGSPMRPSGATNPSSDIDTLKNTFPAMVLSSLRTLVDVGARSSGGSRRPLRYGKQKSGCPSESTSVQLRPEGQAPVPPDAAPQPTPQ